MGQAYINHLIPLPGPIGLFKYMGVIPTHSIMKMEADGSGLEARLEYRLYEGGRLFSQNILSVRIKEDGMAGPVLDHTTRRNHI